MLSKNTLKFIKSLQQKKFRKLENAFFVEGGKNVAELLESDFEVKHLLYTEKFEEEFPRLLNKFKGNKYLVNAQTLEAAGTFQSNDSALAVAKTMPNAAPSIRQNEWVIALDEVRDPGNLGTIIRIADWYGIKQLILSEECAEFYNPKVLHASMGSFTRVKVFYVDFIDYFKSSNLPVYGAFLDGKSVYESNFTESGILLMGNESQGISKRLEPFVKNRVTIPRFGLAESLNVAIATAVICDNIRRTKS